MKRNLRFWTRYTWESMEVTLVTTLVLGVLSLFCVNDLDLSLFASVAPYFLCISAIFGMLMINTGSQTLYVPLLLSMGETRRNVFLGFHYYRTLIITATLVLCGLIWLVIPGEVSAIGLRSLPTLLFVLVAASSFGSILGTILVKWKWAGVVIMVIFCGGIGGCAGMLGVKLADEGIDLAGTVNVTAYLQRLPWWLAAAAGVLLAADILFQWLLLRRQEVKL